MPQQTQAKLNRRALAETEDAEPATKRYQRFPWDGVTQRYGDAPWSIRTWYPDAKSGKICEVQRRYESTVDPMSAGTQERDGMSFKVEDLAQINHELRLDQKGVVEVFKASRADDISLIEAAIRVIGEDELAPKWVAKARKAPAVYAAPLAPVED